MQSRCNALVHGRQCLMQSKHLDTSRAVPLPGRPSAGAGAEGRGIGGRRQRSHGGRTAQAGTEVRVQQGSLVLFHWFRIAPTVCLACDAGSHIRKRGCQILGSTLVALVACLPISCPVWHPRVEQMAEARGRPPFVVPTSREYTEQARQRQPRHRNSHIATSTFIPIIHGV